MELHERVIKILKSTLTRWIEEEDTTEEARKIYKNIIEYIDALIERYREGEK